MPSSSTKVMAAAGKIRRKIRLKRKQRDRMMSNGSHLNVTSTSETDRETEQDEAFCSPLDLCVACLPNNAIHYNNGGGCCCCFGSGQRSHHYNQSRQLWLNAFILFIFAGALASLAYYTMTLQNQLAVLSIHLDPGKATLTSLLLLP